MFQFFDLASRFILHPTTMPLPSAPAVRMLLKTDHIAVEAFRRRTDDDAGTPPTCFALHFGGVAGRAELSSLPPAPFWKSIRCEWWSMNIPGSGGSPGPATFRRYVKAVRATFDAIVREAAGRPLFLSGNSLGTAAAVYCASLAPREGAVVAGLGLRNPPILSQVVLGRFGWKTLWLGAALVAGQIPRELNPLPLVSRITAPAVFLSSRRDRIVPVVYQDRLFDAYAGPKQMLRLEHHDHGDRLSDAETESLAAMYREMFPGVISASR